MREQPWHIRRASAHHQLWYQNLMELRRVTQEWLRELKVERPSQFLGHTASPEIRESLSRLEQVSEQVAGSNPETNLEDLLDESSPEVFLERLQHSIEMLQAWTLRSILQRSELLEVLEQATWRQGRECASARYGALPAASRDDLRFVLAAVEGFPLHPRREGPAFLTERSVRSELRLELLHCPHRSRNPSVLAVADALCQLQDAWIRGYLYEINPRIRMEKDRAPGSEIRCRHRWWLPVQ